MLHGPFHWHGPFRDCESVALNNCTTIRDHGNYMSLSNLPTSPNWLNTKPETTLTDCYVHNRSVFSLCFYFFFLPQLPSSALQNYLLTCFIPFKFPLHTKQSVSYQWLKVCQEENWLEERNLITSSAKCTS